MKFIYQLSILCFLLASFSLNAQNNSPTQIIRGVVTDKSSGAPLPYILVGLLDLPQIGTSTDEDGKFTLTNIPVGRHDIQATFMGYESAVFREIMVTSAKEIYLEIQLKEKIQELGGYCIGSGLGTLKNAKHL